MVNLFQCSKKSVVRSQRSVGPGRRARRQGVSLIELGMSMAIMGVMAVSITAFMTASMEAMNTKRSHAIAHTIGMDFVEQFSRDVRLAGNIQMESNNSIRLFLPNNCTVRWNTAAGRLTRTQENNIAFCRQQYAPSREYTNPTIANHAAGLMRTNCPAPGCFRIQIHDISRNPDGTPLRKQYLNFDGSVTTGEVLSQGTRVLIPELRIEGTVTNSNSPADNAFGRPGFVLRNVAYDVSGVKTFN